MAQIRRVACQSTETLNKSAFVALLDEGSPVQKLLSNLDDSAWFIDSFNAQTREVCITVVQHPNPPRHLSFTFPWFAAKF